VTGNRSDGGRATGAGAGAGMALAERAVAWLLPAGDRESVIGDLREEAAARGADGDAAWRLLAGLRIAAHFHVEPYRDAACVRGVLALSVAGLALLWIVPAATGPGLLVPDFYTDPLLRAVAAMWGRSHVTSAAAAGLLVGHLPAIPAHAARSRWHVALLLAALAFSAADGTAAAWTAALVLLGAAWLGDRGRDAARDDSGGAGVCG